MANFGAAELLIILLILSGPLLLWFWEIIDILKNDFKGSSDKIIWLLVVFFLPFIGLLLYLLIGRGQKIKSNNP